MRWCGDQSRMSCVHSRMSCDHSRTGCAHSTHARRRWRLQCAFTTYLLRNVCSAIARRFFLACSKFDGARSARGVCLAHLGDSTAHVWRTHSVNEDPCAYVAYLPCICDFFSYAVLAQWHRRPVEQGHYSKSKIRGQKHPRDVVKNRNSIPNIKVNT